MPELQMKISVVTAAFNSAKTIGRTIESFLAQDHEAKELIVVDGASTDDTLALARSFGSEAIVVISEPDRGIYDAMNKGLARFSGDAVGFLNSDDRYKDTRSLSEIAAALAQADIVHGNLDFISPGHSAAIVRRWRDTPYSRGRFASGWMPAHPTFYVRRRVVEEVGKFDLQYALAADYDYMLRALELHDFRSAFINRVLVEMQQGGASTGSLKSYLRSNFESYHSRRTWLKTGAFDRALVTKPLRKVGQFLSASQ